MICSKCKIMAGVLLDGLCVNCSPELLAMEKSKMQHTKFKRDLYFALRSRIVTDEEMKLVEQYGVWLCIEDGVSYTPLEKEKEFNDVLFQQFKMRLLAEREKAENEK